MLWDDKLSDALLKLEEVDMDDENRTVSENNLRVGFAYLYRAMVRAINDMRAAGYPQPPETIPGYVDILVAVQTTEAILAGKSVDEIRRMHEDSMERVQNISDYFFRIRERHDESHRKFLREEIRKDLIKEYGLEEVTEIE